MPGLGLIHSFLKNRDFLIIATRMMHKMTGNDNLKVRMEKLIKGAHRGGMALSGLRLIHCGAICWEV